MIGYCYYGSYIYHGEFRFTQECHHFIYVRKIDLWVDFICASPSGFSCDKKFGSPAVKNGGPGRRASAIFNPWDGDYLCPLTITHQISF